MYSNALKLSQLKKRLKGRIPDSSFSENNYKSCSKNISWLLYWWISTDQEKY
jgi:hypothetical protein